MRRCVDWTIYKGATKSPLYVTWRQMMYRCYNPDCTRYSLYGERGVYVCDEWHTFANFEHDVKEIPNWDKKVENWNKYSLDKDTHGTGLLYSKDTCVWATQLEQVNAIGLCKPVLATRTEDGVQFEFQSIGAASRELNIRWNSIKKVLIGEQKTTHGYSFKWNGEPIRVQEFNNGTKVVAITPNNERYEYQSITEASKVLNLRPSDISLIISGKRKTTKGYRFERI